MADPSLTALISSLLTVASGGDDSLLIARLAKTPLTPDAVHALHAHGLSGILIEETRALQEQPQGLVQNLRQLTQKQTALTLLQEEALRELSEALTQAGIRVAAAGAYGLSGRLYPRTGHRPAGDIDLLLPDGNPEALEEILTGIGFQVFRPFPTGTFRRGRVTIDFSLRPWDGLSLTPFPTEERTFPEVFFGWESRLTPGSYPGIFTLSPADEFLFQSIHYVYKHWFTRRIWALDLLLLANILEAEDLKILAQAMPRGCTAVIFAHLMDDLTALVPGFRLPFTIPPDRHPVRHLLIQRARSRPAGPEFRFLLAWWFSPSLAFRWRLGREMILPARVSREGGGWGSIRYLTGLPNRIIRLWQSSEPQKKED